MATEESAVRGVISRATIFFDTSRKILSGMTLQVLEMNWLPQNLEPQRLARKIFQNKGLASDPE